MSRILATLAGLLFLPLTAFAQQQPSALEQEAIGWLDILANAGADLKGFTRAPIPANAKLSETSPWSLDTATGVLLCRGDEAGHEWLRWDQEQGDGILHVEWRFTPVEEGKRYNSGVFVRTSPDGRIWHQAQTGDASGGFLFGETPANGTLKRGKQPVIATDAGTVVKPAGQWNVFEVTAKGPFLSLWSNGQVASTWEAIEVPRGHFGLEAEGWRIEFKKVLYKPLDEKP